MESPIVPGELADWLIAVEQTFLDCHSILHQEFATWHRIQMEEIVEQDSGLFARVEQIQRDEQRVFEDAERFLKLISPLAKRGGQMEPDEVRARSLVEQIVDEGLQLVIRVRKLEAAIDTWLWEAFIRDRGVAD